MWECLKDKPDFNNIRLELASPSLPQTLERMANSDVLPVRVMAGRLFTRLTDKNTQNTSINDIIETVLKIWLSLTIRASRSAWRGATPSTSARCTGR